ncbi:MAG: acyl-CoA carboxylase subunit beta [Desulfatiglans sp.]|jgi:acetyl-CoA carboxylase carboxyltransferase component|nr:acyl-CoA carboxylase subunit beta [Thermodesulfobacteriota bacterium]MEE4354687.1 acyl-CoA carboxylase subunit beta [Desulfatiglans sp.]
MEVKAEARIKQLREIKEKALMGGGEKGIAAQHKKGRLTARERIDYLLDEGSFNEFNMLLSHLEGDPGDGVVSGYGTIDERVVCVYSQDSTIRGGSIGAFHGFKMHKTVERALNMKVPFIGLHDSPGARLPRITESKSAMGDIMEKSGGSIFYPNTQASGYIPQIAAIMGSCAGISVYSPALNDFIFMVDGQSHMFITGPAMVKTVLGEEISYEELGGAEVHCQVSGIADGRFAGEQECLDGIRELLTYLPSSMNESPPIVEMGDDPDRTDENLGDIIPSSADVPYDMHDIIYSLVDQGHFFEIKPEFACEIIVGFGRLNNQVTGFIANQPMVRAGSMTVDSSDKQARFIRFCDCFNIPIVLLVDTPAYMPGSTQEHKGIIRHGAKVLYALCEASVPRIALVLRKAYGGGNLGMGVVPGMGTDMVFYWPIVEIGVLGPNASVELFFGKEIRESENPGEMRQKRLKEYIEKYSNPMREVSANWCIDDIIEPRETRKVLIQSLSFLATKERTKGPNKHHGNIPL